MEDISKKTRKLNHVTSRTTNLEHVWIEEHERMSSLSASWDHEVSGPPTHSTATCALAPQTRVRGVKDHRPKVLKPFTK